MNKRGLVVLAGALLVIVLLVSPRAAGGAVNGESFLLGDEFRISDPTSPECRRTDPQIAYNAAQGEYLVVWTNWWSETFQDIYARRVGNRGELRSHFTAATGAHGDGKARLEPSLAYNAKEGEYLIVYELDTTGDGTKWEVWGRRVAWNGSWQGQEFQILSWPNRSFTEPSVAWNSKRNEYLVVAGAFDTQSFKDNDVAGRRVMADGSTPYPGRNISAQDQVARPHNADVVYNPSNDEYLVVWLELASGSVWDDDVRGARVRGADGTVVTPLLVDAWPAVQVNPTTAVDKEGHYLVAWEQNGGANGFGIYGRELGAEGGWRGERFAIADSSDEERDPAIAINQQTSARFAVWRRQIDSYDILSVSWGPGASWAGTLWQPKRIAEATSYAEPAVAAGPPGYLVVYGRSEGQGKHIFGRVYWPQVAYLPAALGKDQEVLSE